MDYRNILYYIQTLDLSEHTAKAYIWYFREWMTIKNGHYYLFK
jgi:hypothetical protein